MTSRGSDSSAPTPVNDSIDELLEGLPAEPMLPKKRAKPLDRQAPPSSDRRAEDNVVVRDETDPRERARRDLEVSRRQSSTFGTGFLPIHTTQQRVVVAVVMMVTVLGAYAFLRSQRHEATSTIGAPVAPPATIAAAPSALPPAAPLATDVLPPVPTAPAVIASAAATTKSTALTNDHKPPKPHVETRPPSTAPSASANTRTDVARSL